MKHLAIPEYLRGTIKFLTVNGQKVKCLTGVCLSHSCNDLIISLRLLLKSTCHLVKEMIPGIDVF